MSATAFFAFPSQPPSCGEVITNATATLERSNVVQVIPWTACSIGGVIVIKEICHHIDDSSLFFADLTGLNPNVMFELGYAIGRNKRIWLILDESYTEGKRRFQQVRILTTVGYRPYANSEDIHRSFFIDSPHLTLERTIFKEEIEPHLGSWLTTPTRLASNP
jgi:hypothetical protein